jgi:hypothetical protein
MGISAMKEQEGKSLAALKGCLRPGCSCVRVGVSAGAGCVGRGGGRLIQRGWQVKDDSGGRRKGQRKRARSADVP